MFSLTMSYLNYANKMKLMINDNGQDSIFEDSINFTNVSSFYVHWLSWKRNVKAIPHLTTGETQEVWCGTTCCKYF